MKNIIAILLWTCCLMCMGCTEGGQETEVVFETTAGEIRVKLYDDTPGHRDNFIKNVKDGMYTGVTFHRVVRDFMIQTGDPKTRPEGYKVKLTPEGDTITERRDGDEENPDRASDKFQFYIVTGRTCQDADLDAFEQARVQRDTEILYMKKQLANKEKLEALRQARDREGVSNLLEKLLDEAKWEVSENPPITYPHDLRRSYGIHGGAPWLDNEYTVFGEVVEGMKVVESIQKIKTNAQEVPLKEVRILKAYVKE